MIFFEFSISESTRFSKERITETRTIRVKPIIT